MNYYFLLEDSQSFFKILPYWLQYVGFKCKRVADIKEVTQQCYVMQSGFGVTQLITKVLYQTIDTLLDNPNVINQLIIIVDAEEEKINERKNQIIKKIKSYEEEKKVKFDFEYHIFVCNHCFESWLLGNKKIFPDNTEKPDESSYFYKYYSYYDISKNDPEKMTVPENLQETTASYHFHYLHEALRYKKIRYKKKNPMNVATGEYFSELIYRIESTSHLQSFKEFYQYIKNQSS